MREPTSQPAMGLISPTMTCEGPSGSSGSHRPTTARSVPNMRPTSRLTAAKISAGSTPRATSVATLRSAACSSPSLASLSRTARSARHRSSMSVNDTTAPRPSAISSGADTYETRNISPSRRKKQSSSIVTVSPVVRGRSERTLRGRERTAVGMVMVDRLVTVAPEQLTGVGVAERDHRRPIGEPDRAG